METQQVYVKKRSQFGKRCYFSEYDKLEADIQSDPTLARNFNRLDNVSRGIQCGTVFAAHEVIIYDWLYDFTDVMRSQL